MFILQCHILTSFSQETRVWDVPVKVLHDGYIFLSYQGKHFISYRDWYGKHLPCLKNSQAIQYGLYLNTLFFVPSCFVELMQYAVNTFSVTIRLSLSSLKD